MCDRRSRVSGSTVRYSSSIPSVNEGFIAASRVARQEYPPAEVQLVYLMNRCGAGSLVREIRGNGVTLDGAFGTRSTTEMRQTGGASVHLSRGRTPRISSAASVWARTRGPAR